MTLRRRGVSISAGRVLEHGVHTRMQRIRCTASYVGLMMPTWPPSEAAQLLPRSRVGGYKVRAKLAAHAGQSDGKRPAYYRPKSAPVFPNPLGRIVDDAETGESGGGSYSPLV